ncbi:hypothetical protein [Methanosarcina horonobensis]|uniref:hypothetical protein n=1 Tax=Methanosarcina horonobensis TaxID=418008 RepID=UPI00064F1554|nr:hypothetical protein [Methanosarcina horonobensis]
MAEPYSVLIQHEEGRKLLNEVPRTTKEKIEALTKAGIAHVEAGEYEEAKKCFAKPKNSKRNKKKNLFRIHQIIGSPLLKSNAKQKKIPVHSMSILRKNTTLLLFTKLMNSQPK